MHAVALRHHLIVAECLAISMSLWNDEKFLSSKNEIKLFTNPIINNFQVEREFFVVIKINFGEWGEMVPFAWGVASVRNDLFYVTYST